MRRSHLNGIIVSIVASALSSYCCSAFGAILPQEAANEQIPQGDTRIHLSAATNPMNLDAVLKTLVEQAHVTILVEGDPRSLKIPEKDMTQLVEAQDFKDAIIRTATVCNYAVVIPQDSRRMVLFNKRYSRNSEIPEIGPSESLACLRNIYQLISDFLPEPTAGTNVSLGVQMANDFYHSLSPEQLEAMQRNRLRFSDLPADQQQIVKNAALSCYIGTLRDSLGASLLQLQDIDEIRLDRQKEQGFGFFYSPVKGFSSFVPLPPPDPAEVTKATDAPRTYGSDANTSTTVGDILKNLNAAQTSNTYSAPTEILNKSTSLIGNSYSTPDEVIRGVETLFGLSHRMLHHDQQSDYKLSFRQSGKVSRIDELAPAISAAMPVPFLYSLTNAPDESLDALRARVANRPVAAVLARHQNMFQERARRKRLRAIEQLTSARLERYYHQSRSLNSGVYIGGDNATRTSFATYILAAAVEQFGDRLDTTPHFIRRMQELYVTGGLKVDKQGKRYFEMNFSLPGPDGSLQETSSIMAMNIQ